VHRFCLSAIAKNVRGILYRRPALPSLFTLPALFALSLEGNFEGSFPREPRRASRRLFDFIIARGIALRSFVTKDLD
jgi:hypothetical protein